MQYRLNAIDVDKFKRDITDSTILHPFSGSVDELANAYNNGLHSLVDKHAPLCTKGIVLRPHVQGTLTTCTRQSIYDGNWNINIAARS